MEVERPCGPSCEGRSLMGGLLRALAGALKGEGDGMIEKAKADREVAMTALARSNTVADRDAGFAHQDSTQAVAEAGSDRRLGLSEAGATERTNIGEVGANKRLGISEAGQTARLGMSEAGANSRNAASIKGASDLQDKAAGQFTDIKVNADGYVAFDKRGNGKVITDQDGRAIVPPDSRVPATVATAIIKAHTTMKGDDPVITDPDAMFADLQKAEQHYGKTPSSPLYLNSTGGISGAATMSNITQPAATGGLTSNIFGATPTAVTSAPAALPPPQGAIAMLKANPEMNHAFDQKYGQGAAARALGQ
jgi:hypothetical protein